MRRPGDRTLWRAGVPLVAVALAVALETHLWADPGHRLPSGNPDDARQDAWMLAWVADSIRHLHSPFLTHALNAGTGVNLAWNTHTALIGVLLAPVTLTAGPLWGLLLELTLGPALTATSAVWVLRRLGVRRPGAAVGGLVAGFNPAMVAAATAHPDFSWLPLVPVLLWLGLRLLTGDGRPRRVGLLLGVTAGAQLLLNEEVLLMTVLTGLLLAVPLALVHRGLVRIRAGDVLRGSGIAAGVAVVIGAWPLATQLLGPLQVHNPVFLPDYFTTDVTGLVHPTPLQAIANPSTVASSAQFTRGISEPTGYVGWLGLGGLLALAVWRRHDRRVRLALGGAVALWVLSLGAHLKSSGHTTVGTLPWALVEPYPVAESVIPARFVLFAMALVAAACAFAVQAAVQAAAEARPTWVRPVVPAVLAVALGLLLPLPLAAAPEAVPRWFTAGTPGVARGETVLVLPYPSPTVTAPMLWQASAGVRFAMPGGYFLAPDGHGSKAFVGGVQRPSSALFTASAAVPVTPEVRAQLAEDLRGWGVQAVALGPTAAPAGHDRLAALVTTLLGRAPEQVDGVLLWRDVTPEQVLR